MPQYEMLGNKPGNVKNTKHRVFKSTRISAKITYVNWVGNRHVITNSMHSGHTRYISTLLNIKKINMLIIFIIHTFYKNKKIKCFMIKLFYQENFCSVFRQWLRFFSQYTLNKANIHTHVLFCCLKCPMATPSLFFITVMQKNRN